jgi:hypothetical protein
VVEQRSSAMAEPGETRHEICELEERRARALVAADLAVLDALMAPDYIHVDWNGTIRTKDEFLADLMLGRVAFELLEIVENHVTVIGDVAYVAGTYFNIVRENQLRPAPKYARHLRVYARNRASWQLVAHQATEAPLRL